MLEEEGGGGGGGDGVGHLHRPVGPELVRIKLMLGCLCFFFSISDELFIGGIYAYRYCSCVKVTKRKAGNGHSKKIILILL